MGGGVIVGFLAVADAGGWRYRYDPSGVQNVRRGG